jgi:aryl-alcohol dehydrogenase-like predicted oxidoreductase
MRTRDLGTTGLRVSELALGTWGLSGEGYGKVEESEQDSVIERALAFGITLFDTADTYAGGEMEKRLGRLLPKDASVTVATKIGTSSQGALLKKDFSPENLRISTERSLERLGRERIDVLLLHNPSPKTVSRGEAVVTVKELVELGLAHTWGVSAGSSDCAKAAVTAGAPVIELAYNAFHWRQLRAIADDVKEKKIGILAHSVLAYGLLCGNWPTNKEFPSYDHRSERWTADELKRRIVQLNSLRPSVYGSVQSLRSVAVRYVLSSPLVSSAVLGPRKGVQLDQLVRDAGKERRYLPEGGLESLENRVRGIGIQT